MHTRYDAQGCEVFVEVTAAPVLDAAGEVTHIIEACRDITQRKTGGGGSRTGPQSSPHPYRQPTGLHLRQGYQGRFIAANLATAHTMGVATPNDLLGKSDSDFYPPERRRSIMPTRKNYCVRGNRWSTKKNSTWTRTVSEGHRNDEGAAQGWRWKERGLGGDKPRHH